MAEQLREQHAFYYDEHQRIPRRRSASRQDLEARRTGNARPTRTPNTADDDILDERPGRLPTSTRRYNLAAPEREYLIPLTDDTALYVTERELATTGRDSQAAARQVTPGARTQRQPGPAQPNPNRAELPPDVIYAPPARSTQAPQAYAPTLRERRSRLPGRVLLVLGIVMIVMLLGYVLLNLLTNWWQVQQDDWQYGRPRTFQIDWNVGHGTASQPDSHFIAQNLNRKIVIIEIPADDPSKAKMYVGPSLIGLGQDLTPVTLSFEDRNHDGHPDLLIHVRDATYLFLNQLVRGVWQFVPAPNQ